MAIFTDHLRYEAEVIRTGLARLDEIRRSIESGTEPGIEDLRLKAFALRVLFKRSYITKIESILYPSIRTVYPGDSNGFDDQIQRQYNDQAQFNLMRLQMELDCFTTRHSTSDLTSCLASCIDVIEQVLTKTSTVALQLADRLLSSAQQEELYRQALEVDTVHASERLQARQILSIENLSLASGS